MQTFIELLKQRRIWAGIAGSVSLFLMAFGAKYNLEMQGFTDILNNFGIALANLLTIVLPLFSFFKPKSNAGTPR